MKKNTITSLEVADMMEIKHWEVLRKLEGTDKVKGIIQVLTNNKIVVSNYFIESTYKDLSGKENRCYRLTKLGCDFLANKFTGEKGIIFTAKYVKRFNQMEEQLVRPKSLSPLEQLRAQYQVLEEHQEQINEMSIKVNKLENTMTIDYAQQQELHTLANRSVVKILGGKDTPAYKELSKKAFSTVWRDFKRIMNVSSYRNTAVKEFERAVEFIKTWKPNRELELMIKGANTQLILDVE